MSFDSIEYIRWTKTDVADLECLESYRCDMQDAREFFQRCSRTDGRSDYTILDALATAAIVRYYRCFSSGARRPLIDIPHLTDASEADVALHRTLADIRNRHDAHAINEFETSNVYVGIAINESGLAVATTVSTGALRGPSVDAQLAIRAAALCEKWIAWLSGKIEDRTAELLREAQGLTSEELLSLPRGPTLPHRDPRRRRQVPT